ncbi:GGDEF domain-containing protein [Undibacterium sp. Ji83W]|uniref:GGDEF domain-containing protein n=1 Tax=Undibacterium sp. Ji83W TaxID=3413043 RepID=UPI003BF2CC13
MSTNDRDDLHRFVLEFRSHLVFINAIFSLLFAALRIWPLAATFVIATILHIFLRKWDKTHPTQSESWTPWMWFVFLMQFIFTVITVGPTAGFQFYMIATIPALFANMRWSLSAKILQVTIIALFFFVCDFWLSWWTPLYALDPSLSNFLHKLNILGTCAVTSTVSYTLYLTIKQAEQKFKRLASTDALTGLLNRRRMTELADKEFARSIRVSVPLSLLICDIDHFKLINDRYGHDAGDQVLKVVGDIFRSLREYDSVARWGGEEFLVLLPDADCNIAQNVAERLREKVAQVVISINDTQISVTMTFGVAQIERNEPWQSALNRADKALYQGKEGGRNQVICSSFDLIGG